MSVSLMMGDNGPGELAECQVELELGAGRRLHPMRHRVDDPWRSEHNGTVGCPKFRDHRRQIQPVGKPGI